MPQIQKAVLRSELLKRREALPASFVQQASARIADHVKSLPEFQRARTVHCYVSWRNEVDTRQLIRDMLASGRRVVVPVVDLKHHALRHSEITRFEDLAPGTFGILEPRPDRFRTVAPQELDLVIVPGVMFDFHGNRIGFGGGYYDGFLRLVTCPKVGLAYRFQLVERLPHRADDEPVDIIVTEAGVVRTE